MIEAVDAGTLLLAASASSNPLTSSGLWGVIQTFFRAVGGIIIVLLIWKAVSAFVKGQPGEMARSIVVGLIVATLTFNLQLPIQLAQSMGGLVAGAVDLISGIANSDGTGEACVLCDRPPASETPYSGPINADGTPCAPGAVACID